MSLNTPAFIFGHPSFSFSAFSDLDTWSVTSGEEKKDSVEDRLRLFDFLRFDLELSFPI